MISEKQLFDSYDDYRNYSKGVENKGLRRIKTESEKAKVSQDFLGVLCHKNNILFIGIKILSTKIIFLFTGRIRKRSLGIIKFVSTFFTSIFWCLPFSDSNLNTFTFWTDSDKILCYLDIFIGRSFYGFFFFQKSISNLDMVVIFIKKPVGKLSIIVICL